MGETHEVWPEGFDRIVLDETDSTMDEAARRLTSFARPTWIMARRQTAPRGRRGNRWATPEGAFAATVAIRPGGAAGMAALRSFVAANALFETVAMYVPRERLSLKWPNDVLLDGGKVAGILLEAQGRGDEVDWLTIGFGVNLMGPPAHVADAAFPPVGLFDAGGDPADPDEFLDTLALNFATGERILDELGFDAVREDWLRHAARLGEVITARTGRREVTGRFETVDPTGALVLQTPEGAERISAADVFFPD